MPTLTLSKASSSGRVPNEFLGRARVLRNLIGEPATIAKAQIAQLIKPLTPRPGFTPMPRYELLKHVRDHWLKLPKLGRLDVLAEFEKGKLRVGEMRLTPTKLRYKAWESDDWEQSISIHTSLAIIQPPTFVCDRRDIAAFGLHSIARRYERGKDKSDEAVMNDLHAVAHYQGQDREFEVKVHGGAWIGENILIDGKVVAMVRTFC